MRWGKGMKVFLRCVPFFFFLLYFYFVEILLAFVGDSVLWASLVLSRVACAAFSRLRLLRSNFLNFGPAPAALGALRLLCFALVKPWIYAYEVGRGRSLALPLRDHLITERFSQSYHR